MEPKPKKAAPPLQSPAKIKTVPKQAKLKESTITKSRKAVKTNKKFSKEPIAQGKLSFKPLRTPRPDRDNKPEPEPLVSEPDEPQVEIIPEPIPVLPLQAS